MANNIPDFRTADELIRSWFTKEAQEFQGKIESFREDIGEWVFSAYLQGHEDGYEQGESEGYEEGRSVGQQDGYEEGYEDARAEFEDDGY